MFKNDFNQIFPKIYKNSKNTEILGIDTDLITSEDSRFSEQFNCKLCIANIPLIPFQCKICNNIFCKECCLNLKECPFRCGSSNFIPLSNQLKNVLELIKFKCINIKNGCNQILEYRNFINHVNNECKFNPFFQCLICKNFKGNFYECKKHFDLCGNKEKKCKFCLMNVKNFLLNEHEEKCKIKEIFCEFCNKKLIRKDYFEHINNICIERIIKCDLCKISYKFKEKEKFHSKEICYKKQIEILNKKNLEQAKTIVDFIINKKNKNDVCNFCSLLEMNYKAILNDKNKEIENLKIDKENFQNILLNQENEIKNLKLKIQEYKNIINKKENKIDSLKNQSNNNINNFYNNNNINNDNNHNNINNYEDINFKKKNKFNNESNYFLFAESKNNQNNNNLNNNHNKIKNNNSINNKKNKKYELNFNNELTPNNIENNENNNPKRSKTEKNKKNNEENNEKDECKIF